MIRRLTCRGTCWQARRKAAPAAPEDHRPQREADPALLQAVDAAALDLLIGGWLAALAAAGRLEEELRPVAIDGKWLRGVGDGQVKLFSAMLHADRVVIGQVRVPDDTTEVTQVKGLLAGVDLDGAVVTADAVHACRETAGHIAGVKDDAISLLHLSGTTQVTRTVQAISRNPARVLDVIPL